VALVGRAVRQLQALFPKKVKVREVSGRIDRQERAVTQADLSNAAQSVLVIGTSAVDVGVDFRIHLLIFEAGDSAIFVQRLGRLGRHSGFSTTQSLCLLSGRTRGLGARLCRRSMRRSRSAGSGSEIEGSIHPEFEQYRKYWGALRLRECCSA